MQMELSQSRRRALIDRARNNAEAFRLLARYPFVSAQGRDAFEATAELYEARADAMQRRSA